MQSCALIRTRASIVLIRFAVFWRDGSDLVYHARSRGLCAADDRRRSRQGNQGQGAMLYSVFSIARCFARDTVAEAEVWVNTTSEKCPASHAVLFSLSLSFLSRVLLFHCISFVVPVLGVLCAQELLRIQYFICEVMFTHFPFCDIFSHRSVTRRNSG